MAQPPSDERGAGQLDMQFWYSAAAACLHFGGGAEVLELANPISSEMTTMRPSLLPGLVGAAQANANRGFSDVALFAVLEACIALLRLGQSQELAVGCVCRQRHEQNQAKRKLRVRAPPRI